MIFLGLLGLFGLRIHDEPVELPPAAQRVVALTALHGGSVPRARLAGTLWPDRCEERALANLRGVLWRMPSDLHRCIQSRGVSIAFPRDWRVDVDQAAEAARQLRQRAVPGTTDRRVFSQDLLPDWDDEWLVMLRERHRQLRLHALEDLASVQIAEGRPLDAVDTAMEALAAEPLRESAQLMVLRAHLAAGNRALVLEQFARFRRLLASELSVEPSRVMQQTVAEAQGSR